MSNHFGLKRIIHHFAAKTRDFFPEHMKPQIRELYTTMAILDFAVSSVMIFEPIYLFTLGFPLYQIMLFYLAVYLLYFIVMPIGGKVAKRKGFEHSITYGSFFLVLYYVFLFNIPANPGFVILAIFALAIQKSLFWPGYHADFAFYGQSGERGRQISNLAVVDSLVYIAGPLIGGIIIGLFGFKVLFIFACLIILCSSIPLFATKEVFKPSNYDYSPCYLRLLKTENRRHLIGYLGYGEELIVLTIWPIYMYAIIQNLTGVGSMVAISTLVTTMALLYIGKLTDKTDRHQVLRVGSVFYSLAWFLKILARGGLGIFLVDFTSRTTKSIVTVPLIAGLYERAAKTSVVKTVIFFEMSLTVGKIFASAILAVVFFFFPNAYSAAFVLGGIFSLLYLQLGTDISFLSLNVLKYVKNIFKVNKVK